MRVCMNACMHVCMTRLGLVVEIFNIVVWEPAFISRNEMDALMVWGGGVAAICKDSTSCLGFRASCGTDARRICLEPRHSST